MIYIVDKNKKLIDALEKADINNNVVQVRHGDIFQFAKEHNCKIATASNPDWDFAGGLDAEIAKRFNVSEADEFHYTKDLFFVISVNSERQATISIVQRAMAGIYAFHKEFDIAVSGVGTGIGGLDFYSFVEIIEKISYAHLEDVNLQSANLKFANLESANLEFANLESAILESANLKFANLEFAKLESANLKFAILKFANLESAILKFANLKNIKHNYLTSFFSLQCPEVGAFVGWKKCKDDVIVKLLVPSRAKRSSATSRKCRAEYVKVLKVCGAEIGVSDYNNNVIYKKGEIVKCDKWDENRWEECSGGIHFFITREEAEQYSR